jgi:sec-independent protein translocase protein TatA
MGAISPVHVVFVLIIALIVIGPSKLPETGAALGKAIREFREAAGGGDEATPEDPKTDASEPNQ